MADRSVYGDVSATRGPTVYYTPQGVFFTQRGVLWLVRDVYEDAGVWWEPFPADPGLVTHRAFEEIQKTPLPEAQLARALRQQAEPTTTGKRDQKRYGQLLGTRHGRHAFTASDSRDLVPLVAADHREAARLVRSQWRIAVPSEMVRYRMVGAGAGLVQLARALGLTG
jgi:hypothetical protein